MGALMITPADEKIKSEKSGKRTPSRNFCFISMLCFGFNFHSLSGGCGAVTADFLSFLNCNFVNTFYIYDRFHFRAVTFTELPQCPKAPVNCCLEIRETGTLCVVAAP
jgi:hypothetical protein